jgi:predicted nucleic acid-binding protein
MAPVLVDSSVWVAHFRRPDGTLQYLLSTDQALCHPLIVLELACGTPPAPRERTLSDLRRLKQSVIATIDETLSLIEREHLEDRGCGAVDISLLASTLLTRGAMLWTADRDLGELATKLGVAFR